MTRIVDLEQIKQVIQPDKAIAAIEAGFSLYSQGKVVVPPVGHLNFDDPPGDVHIKYGYILNDDYYVVKVASGFYQNPQRDLPTNNGSMLVYRQQTGELLAILLDEGYLTELRTGAAGAVAVKYLAPSSVDRIGIVGSGVQARYQLESLQHVVTCRDVLVWGRDVDRLATYKSDMEQLGFSVETTQAIADIPASCSLIVTTTPSKSALLAQEHIRPGTHITAVGSDGYGKQELDAKILLGADIVAADSKSQRMEYGEISSAIKAGMDERKVQELGVIIGGDVFGRTSDTQITVADLTGVAIQDIQIAKMAYEALV